MGANLRGDGDWVRLTGYLAVRDTAMTAFCFQHTGAMSRSGYRTSC